MSLDLSYKNKTSIQSNTINDANAETHHRKFVHNAYKRTHNLGTCINKWISKSKHKQTKIVFTRAASASSPDRLKKSQQQFQASFVSLWVCSVTTLRLRGMRGRGISRCAQGGRSTRKIECIRKTSFARQSIGFVIVNLIRPLCPNATSYDQSEHCIQE
jgi:hypothetical protein